MLVVADQPRRIVASDADLVVLGGAAGDGRGVEPRDVGAKVAEGVAALDAIRLECLVEPAVEGRGWEGGDEALEGEQCEEHTLAAVGSEICDPGGLARRPDDLATSGLERRTSQSGGHAAGKEQGAERVASPGLQPLRSYLPY